MGHTQAQAQLNKQQLEQRTVTHAVVVMEVAVDGVSVRQETKRDSSNHCQGRSDGLAKEQ